MTRPVCVCLLTVGFAFVHVAWAQSAPSSPAPTLASLEQNVKDKTAEWDQLAQNLDPTLVRLLPCDPKAAAAIAEVIKASEARVAAVSAYLDAASRDALLQTNGAKQVLASAQALNPDVAAEKSDLGPERTGLDGQIANLTQSASSRASLAVPSENLKQILAIQQQRSDTVDSATMHDAAAVTALSDFVMQLTARQSAWTDVHSAFDAEASRWAAYYSARQARAEMECTITKGTAAVPATKAAPRGPAPSIPAKGTQK